MEKAMFEVVEWTENSISDFWEFNIWLLAVLKNDLFEVDKTMFLGFQIPLENIFWFLGIQKWDLVEVEEAMFKVVECPENSISCFWMPQKATLWNSIKRYFKCWKSPKSSFPAFYTPQITTWLKSKERCFMVSTQPATGLSAFWRTQMRLWRDRERDVSSGPMSMRTQYLPSGCPKIQLVSSWKTIFLGVQSPCEVIVWFLDIQKCDLVEGAEAMFQVVE
jgi:hypothetical protein